jgi:hypothetical protein
VLAVDEEQKVPTSIKAKRLSTLQIVVKATTTQWKTMLLSGWYGYEEESIK